MKLTLLFCIGNIVSLFCNSQTLQNKLWQDVLNKNNPDSTYIFNHSKKNYHDETYLTYLGLAKTKDGRSFKILKSCWIWGQSKRATGRIIFFNINNQYIGEYSVGGLFDLPEKLIDNSLVFTNSPDNSCDSALSTVISFRLGIPKIIFIKCKGKFGNLYTFSSN